MASVWVVEFKRKRESEWKIDSAALFATKAQAEAELSLGLKSFDYRVSEYRRVEEQNG